MESETLNRPSLQAMRARLLRPPEQSRAAKTVEVFGWLVFAEGALLVFFPAPVMVLLGGGMLEDPAAGLFRLVGLLAGGVGMLYVVSGRLDAQGFVFASLLDRPLVPPLMAIFWYLGFLPGGLALAFAVQDFGGFLWTLHAWRREQGQRS